MHDIRDAAGLTDESYTAPEMEPGPPASRGENIAWREYFWSIVQSIGNRII
jgi:hypothetical protein